MLDRVNADIPAERDPVRAGRLRMLRMRLEHRQELQAMGEPAAAEGAPMGVTIH
jgi:hypothetical protein